MSDDPFKAFLEGRTKTAAPSPTPGVWGRAVNSIPGHFGSAAAGAAAAGAVGLIGAGIGSAVSGILNAATKGHDFKQMLMHNEDLHEHHERDPKRFNLMFNTLRNMNPEFSKDPLIAGSFMRRMIESPTGIGGIAGEALKQRGDFPESAFGVAHDFAREGAKAGITESMRQRSPEELFEQEKPRMDYQHGQQKERDAFNFARELHKQDRGFGHDDAQSQAQRQHQEHLQRMPTHEESTQYRQNRGVMGVEGKTEKTTRRG